MKMTIVVPGIPIPKGSTTSYMVNSKIVTTNANKRTKAWQDAISILVRSSWKGEPSRDAISVRAYFTMPRPQNPKGEYHLVKPDLDKLIRAVLDAMTGIVYTDDSQVVVINSYKVYGTSPGLRLEVEEMEQP